MKNLVINLSILTMFFALLPQLANAGQAPSVEYCCCNNDSFVCESPNLPCGPAQTWAPRTECSGSVSSPGVRTPEPIRLDNPLGSNNDPNSTDISKLLGRVIRGALGVIGSLTLLMMVWGGFQWLTSAGNAEKVKSGTQTMVWAAIGVILVFSSYIILNTFLEFMRGEGGGSGGGGGGGGGESRCQQQGGTCGTPASCTSDRGRVQTGLCPGGNDNVCCLPRSNP